MAKEKLTVYEMEVHDAWKDMARIPKNHRVDATGKRIRRAKICDVTIGGKHELLAIRGCPDKDARVLLDSPTRIDLEVEIGASYDVGLRPRRVVRLLALGVGRCRPCLSRICPDKSDLSVLGGFGAISLWPLVHP